MLCLFTGAFLGLLGAFFASMLGATWGQVFLTYVVVGIVMSLVSGLLMTKDTGDKIDDHIRFAGHGEGRPGQAIKRISGSDRIG